MRTRPRHAHALRIVLIVTPFLVALAQAAPIAPPPSGDDGGGPAVPATIRLAPGSDQLQAAIRSAGPGGTVILAAGRHSESTTVTLRQPVTLAGEAGAVLESAVAPSVSYPLTVQPALRLLGTGGVRIEGLELRPAAGHAGGTAILIDASPGAVIAGNTMVDFQIGVLLRRGDDAEIRENTIAVTPDGLSGTLPEAHGVVVIQGARVILDANLISGGTSGIWAADADGEVSASTLTGNRIGLMLRRVPEGTFSIAGDPSGSPDSASFWEVRDNATVGNGWGFLLGDGAHDNQLAGNSGRGNGRYDIELAGATDRFGGRMLPASFENRVASFNDKGLVIKDCGLKNRITGAARNVSTDVDPCD